MRFLFSVFLFPAMLCFANVSFAQEKFTISGYVKEASTGENLLGTNVYVKETLQGTTTNTYGFYSMTLPKGHYTLVVSFIGYVDQQFPIQLDKDLRQNISLDNTPIETKEVTVSAE